VFTQTIPALFAGGVCGVLAAFAAGAFEGAAGVAAGSPAGVAEAAGVEAGEGVVDFADVAAGAADALVGAADVVDFFERLFLGVALSALAAAEAGAAEAEASVEAVPFFERDFLGAAELSEAALLSATSAFFDVLFFLEDTAPESDAAWTPEASASVFFFFLFFLALPASVWLLSPGCWAACAQTVTLPANSKKAPNRAMCILLVAFILKLSLRPRRLIHFAKQSQECGWAGGGDLSCASRVFQAEWAHHVREQLQSQEKRNGGRYKCTAHKSASRQDEFEWELQGYFWGNQEVVILLLPGDLAALLWGWDLRL